MTKPSHHSRRHRAQGARPHGVGHRAGASDTPDVVRLWGNHACAAAIANPARKLLKVWGTENALQRLGPALASRGISPEHAEPRALDRLVGADAVHQGIVMDARPLPDRDLAELASPGEDAAHSLLVVLDQVTDPHNVGAILRTAAAFGATGLVMTRQHSPPLGGVLAKAASGALDLVPIALETNLARTIETLKSLDVCCIGLDGEAAAAIEGMDLDRSVALVLGSEGKGLRRLTRESCDVLCKITTAGSLASLNVSNAAAVALHCVAEARRKA